MISKFTRRLEPLRWLASALLVSLVVTVAGCAEAIRPPGTPLGVTALPPWGSVSNPDNVTRPKIHGKSAEVLVISGGGANIAFTAGLINGWAARGDLPDFDVVTGISSGALVSTFIFLGEGYDKELRQSVIFHDSSDIIHRRSIINTLFNVSLGTSTPLEKRLYGFITDDIIEKVAAKYKKGYGLFVASTDLDGQKSIVWNLGAIAASNRKNKRDIYIRAILASASVPLLFDPVYIPVRGSDGKPYHAMHVDGGIIDNVLLYEYMLPKVGKKGRVHVIRNGVNSAEYERVPVEPRLWSIAKSTFETSFNNAFDLIVTLEALKADSVGYRSFHVTSIPERFPREIKKEIGKSFSSLSFSAKATKLLYDKSFQLAKKGNVVWIDHNKIIKAPL